jgi:polysaccharide biosynthesis protein PslH
MRKDKLLVVLPRFPFPLEKGDKLRAFNQVKILSDNYSICLIALSPVKVADNYLNEVYPFVEQIHIIQYSKQLAMLRVVHALLLTRMPLQAAMFCSGSMARRVHAIAEAWQGDLCYLQLARSAELVRNMPKPYKVVLDFQDAFSANYARTSKQSVWYLKPLYALEAKRMHMYEQQLLQRFNAHTIISAADRQLLQNSNIIVVRNGVDEHYFTPQKSESKYELLFVGNLSYQPNVLAVDFLITKILPHLNSAPPKVLIAGASPTLALRNLQETNVEVQAWLPDIRMAYNAAKIFVAPLFSGAGLQNKILEAMSMEVPCITTPIVAKGLGAVHMQQVIVASTEQEFVDAILLLRANQLLVDTIVANAKRFVLENYSWASNTLPLLHLLQAVK